jgi:hypothetical protein
MLVIRGGFHYTLTSKNHSPKCRTRNKRGGEQGDIFVKKLMTQVLRFRLNSQRVLTPLHCVLGLTMAVFIVIYVGLSVVIFIETMCLTSHNSLARWTTKTTLWNWFPMMPSIATKFQYVNSLLFFFSLTICFCPYGLSSGEIYNMIFLMDYFYYNGSVARNAIWCRNVTCCASVLRLCIPNTCYQLNVNIKIINIK